MNVALMAAGDGGGAFVGMLILGGLIWLICKAFSKPKGYDLEVRSKGKITPRR